MCTGVKVKSHFAIYHVGRRELCAKIRGERIVVSSEWHCVILCQDCVNRVSCVGRVWYVWAVGRKCEKNMTDSSQSRKWQTIVWSHYGAILDLLDNENNGSQAEVVLSLHTAPACGDRNKIQKNNANVIINSMYKIVLHHHDCVTSGQYVLFQHPITHSLNYDEPIWNSKVKYMDFEKLKK